MPPEVDLSSSSEPYALFQPPGPYPPSSALAPLALAVTSLLLIAAAARGRGGGANFASSSSRAAAAAADDDTLAAVAWLERVAPALREDGDGLEGMRDGGANSAGGDDADVNAASLAERRWTIEEEEDAVGWLEEEGRGEGEGE